MNNLIFIEGPKGVGKSQVIAKSRYTYTTYEPWNDDIAHLASEDPYNPVNPTTQAMLYIADRRVHMQSIPDWLEKNAVICDRGPLSTMVYQGLVGGVDLDWLLSLNRVAMEGVEVAATILLHAPFDITVQRIEGRGTPLTPQERDQLRPAWEAYESLRLGAHDANGHLQHFVEKWKDLTGWIHFIDANRPVEQVEADVMSTINRILGAE